MATTNTGVGSQHPAFAAMSAQWKRCRDTVSGGDAVKAAKTLYLPKLHEQSDDEYAAYQGRALFYNATWRTIDGLTGMLFRKDPQVEVPTSIEPMLQDVTMSGKPMLIFTREVAHEIQTVGRVGLFVDRPATPTEGMTEAQVQALNLRPFIQLYKAETIYNWKCAWVNNRYVLVEVRLSEDFALDPDPAKPFDNPKTEPRYRVLDLIPVNGAYTYRVRVFKVKDNEDIQLSESFPLMDGNPLDFIPFYFLGTEDMSPDVDEPPLIDLVDANLNHYRLDADYKHGLHFTGLPTPYVTGFRQTEENKNVKLYIGSTAAWTLSDPNSKAGFLEFTGQGLQAMEKGLDRLEQHMAILGARMLSPDRKMAEAAETAQIHRAGEQSVLAKVAGTMSMGLTVAMKTLTDWAGVDSKDVTVEINREFMPVLMDAQTLTALVMGWQSGAYSTESLFRKLQQGDVIADSVTFEEEQERIDNAAPNLSAGYIDNNDRQGG
ncbi:MAG: DUF4055 domain-containing protein [Syntrophales bacterium]|nr:DUF4055 domain-containing protein [Syntrophales bacterium]